jgi:hypothetical protein
MPNLGLNTAEWRIGLIYKQEPEAEKRNITFRQMPLEKKILFNVNFGLGSEQFKSPDGPTFPVYIVAAFASYQVSRSSKINLGLEWNYYPANQAFNTNLDIPPGEVSPQFKPSRTSAVLGHELMFGKIGFQVALFMYVDYPFQGDGWFGNKLGPIYYFYKPYEKGRRRNIFLSGNLKSHGTIADYVAINLGFTF